MDKQNAETCEQCRFWDGVGPIGYCRKRAPLTKLLLWLIRPITKWDYWCGEWCSKEKAKEQSP